MFVLSFRALFWGDADSEWVIRPFKRTSRLHVEVSCTHKREGEDHVIAHHTNFDIFPAGFSDDVEITLSSVGGGSLGASSMTLRFGVPQTGRFFQSPSEIQGFFEQQRIPEAGFPGMGIINNDLLSRIMPPAWVVVMTSLGRIVDASKPIAEVSFFVLAHACPTFSGLFPA